MEHIYFNSNDEKIALPVTAKLQNETNTRKLSFQEVNEAALKNLPDVLDALGLRADGKHVGKQFQMLNPKRSDGELGSFSINTETGVWADFATEDKGGDVISLVAFITEQNQGQAKKWLAKQLGLADTDATSTQLVAEAVEQVAATQPVQPEAAQGKAKPICIQPIPEDMANRVLALEDRKAGSLGMWNGVPIISIELYAYRNEKGQINSFVLRHNLANGKKEVRPRSCWQSKTNQPSMVFKAPTQPYTVYNLDLLVKRPDAPVLVVEGEKSADAASQLFPDHVVVTTLSGAQSPLKSDLMPLVGRQVTFWPDNDEAGLGYVDKIAGFLHGEDPSMVMHILTPPNFKARKNSDGIAVLEPMEEKLLQGWDAADALAEGWIAEHIRLLPREQYVHYALAEPELGPEAIIETYAAGYSVYEGNLCLSKYDSNEGEMVYKAVCSELVVVGQTRDENNQNWGQLVQFYDHDGKVHELPIPRELLAGGSGESFVKGLLSHGLVVYNEKCLKEYIMTAKHPGRALCVKQIGWHRDAFVLPEKTFGENGERVLLQTSDLSRQSAYVAKGSLEDWQRNVASLCTGNSRLILALSVALAGPFLKPVNIENGGFHFRGASSTGKSKTLFTAASVWGNNQMVRVWRTTDNAVESLALSHNDTVLCLDELGQVDPSKAGDIAYTLANGLSKARSTQSGAIRSIMRWRLLFLSTGEIGLADHMATTGGTARAGQEIRMLDIPADAQCGMGVFENIHGVSSPAEFADLLQRNADLFHGSAGEALLEGLTHPGEMTLAMEFVKAKMAEFTRNHVPAGAHGQIHRAGGRFAFVAGVGEYCIDRGILPFSAGEVSSAVGTCFKAWLAERGGDQAMEEFRALEKVRAYLEHYGESRFSSMNEYHFSMGTAPRTNQRAGFKNELEDGTMEYWVLPEMYREEICKGLDPKLVTRVLIKHGFLELDSRGNPQIAKRIPGIGPKRVYVIKPTTLQSQEDQPMAV